MALFALTLLGAGLGVVGWRVARGGLRSGAPPPLRGLPLPLLAFALQWVALGSAGGALRLGLMAVSQALLLGFFAANYRYRPLRLLGLGFLLNGAAMLTGGGYMPITPEAMAVLHPGADDWPAGFVRAGSKDIVLPAAQSPLWFLGDALALGVPFPLPTAFSVGDCLILAGFAWTVYHFTSPQGETNATHRIGAAGDGGSG